MKTYTIIKTHRGRATETTGTLPELVEYFGYTLKAGASYNGQKGCKKVNDNPKTIKSLMTALQNSVYNTQGNCYEQDSYDYTEVVTETKTDKKTTKKSIKKQAVITATLKAFTGMIIGTYNVEMTKDGYKLTTKDGKVLEFNTSGAQTNAKNPKFGNKIEILDVAEA